MSDTKREAGWYSCAWINSDFSRHKDLAYWDGDGWKCSADAEPDEILDPDEIGQRIPDNATLEAMQALCAAMDAALLEDIGERAEVGDTGLEDKLALDKIAVLRRAVDAAGKQEVGNG